MIYDVNLQICRASVAQLASAFGWGRLFWLWHQNYYFYSLSCQLKSKINFWSLNVSLWRRNFNSNPAVCYDRRSPFFRIFISFHFFSFFLYFLDWRTFKSAKMNRHSYYRKHSCSYRLKLLTEMKQKQTFNSSLWMFYNIIEETNKFKIQVYILWEN